MSVRWKEYHGEGVHLKDLRKELFLSMNLIETLPPRVWSKYRNDMNAYDFPDRQVALNRAYFKLWEILKTNETYIPQSVGKTFHIAEAPGSFVQVCHRLFPKANHTAISRPQFRDRDIPTFNPSVRNIPQFSFDYLDVTIPDELWKSIGLASKPNGLKPDFITADGGIDERGCFENKEELHYRLKLAEIITILNTQRLNGSCCLKIFETFTETSISLYYLLCKYYQNFKFIKPKTSRPTNSERYLLCGKFKGCKDASILSSLLNQNEITSDWVLDHHVPDDFRADLLSFTEECTRIQIGCIKEIVKSATEKQVYETHQIMRFKQDAFEDWKTQTRFDIS